MILNWKGIGGKSPTHMIKINFRNTLNIDVDLENSYVSVGELRHFISQGNRISLADVAL